MSTDRSTRFVPFSYGFRPFFLLAGIYAVFGVLSWLWVYRSGLMPLGSVPSQFWHGHEMLYGFVAAAIAGFMLTAVPSWTGSRGYAGKPLQLLVFLWLAGRLAFLFAGSLPFWLLAAIELAFVPALMLILAPSLLRTWSRNTPLLLVLLLFWAGDAMFMLGLANSETVMSARGLRVGINLVLVLLTVIGGRIVPAFTGNALRGHAVPVQMRSSALLDRFTIVAMLAYAIADIIAPLHSNTGWIALIAALAQCVRLSGWQGMRTLSQPIVWVLHVAYLWLPVGLALKALYLLGGFAWAAHWQHALGAGAAGTMILAVMTRASLGHTGRPLVVNRLTIAAYVLLVLAVTTRVFGAAVLSLPYQTVVLLAGGLWAAAFSLFVVVYTPVLLLPRCDGKPG